MIVIFGYVCAALLALATLVALLGALGFFGLFLNLEQEDKLVTWTVGVMITSFLVSWFTLLVRALS